MELQREKNKGEKVIINKETWSHIEPQCPPSITAAPLPSQRGPQHCCALQGSENTVCFYRDAGIRGPILLFWFCFCL